MGDVRFLRGDCGLQHDASHRLAIVRFVYTCDHINVCPCQNHCKASLPARTYERIIRRECIVCRYEESIAEHTNARGILSQIRDEVSLARAKVGCRISPGECACRDNASAYGATLRLLPLRENFHHLAHVWMFLSRTPDKGLGYATFDPGRNATQ